MSEPNTQDAANTFIEKWKGVSASELSTSQSFLIELCELLGVPRPHATADQDYMFERPLTFHHHDGSTSAGRVDLYRQGSFVLESKKYRANTQTRGFDEAMKRAHTQAQAYARALPAAEGRPPFVLVVDVGHRIELYSEFSRSGGSYVPFPDPRSHRIALDDLRNPETLDRLRRIWLDPLSLDPSREAARVTRDIAKQLAELAKSLERSGHAAEAVAQFLMRCLFTMFAEDVRLLPHDSFRELLMRYADQPDTAMRMVGQLWRDMDTGGFSAVLADDVLQFNGKLFKQPDTLPLDSAQIRLLADAAQAKWEHVEPAIFGTLLERALSPGERHKVGAHYTPRAYVERLVLPTVIEPLRAEWSDAQTAALTLAAEDKHDAAVAALLSFHHRLCNVRVLDPACGSGNFLYVTLEHLKRLEGEVLRALDDLGYQQAGLALGGERADALGGETVDPHNLLGIEINPRAAAIAEVVLWIGYLQWHFRTRGDVHPPVPVIRDFRHIENRDAVLAHDGMDYATDDDGIPVTRWDGVSMKTSPVTGEPIPDDHAQVPVEFYVNPRKAEWPAADFVVGNPPFIGSKRMRELLGDGYVDAVQSAWPEVPQASNFVLRWWHHAAQLTRSGDLERFGLITSNSIRQVFDRRVIEPHMAGVKQPLSIVFAIPDHPWVDSSDGAAVRIAMTTARAGAHTGDLLTVLEERDFADSGVDDVVASFKAEVGRIHADLSVGVDVTLARRLLANADVCSVGMKTIGSAFQIELERAHELGIRKIPGLDSYIRPYINGRDFTGSERGKYVVDFYGLEIEDIRWRFPASYQHLLERAKPERDLNRNALFRERWWVIGHPRPQFREATAGLSRFIATVETSKHRFFSFLPTSVTPDSTLVTFASESAGVLGCLCSTVHGTWVEANAGSMGVYIGNVRYNKTICFEPFPFPNFVPATTDRVADLAEQLDAHRKNQQAAHPGLTLTGMYNVLEKLRSGEALNPKERTIHEHGLVSLMRQLHDELDAAVLAAYGWSDLLPLLRIAHGNDAPEQGQSRDDAKRAFDNSVLERLVALNAERAAEEARGVVRWLRPEFQNPQEAAPGSQQGELATHAADDTDTSTEISNAAKPLPWPRDAVEQVRAIADLLAAYPGPITLEQIGNRFTARGPWKKRLPHLLDMLVAMGRARSVDDGYRGQ